MGIRNRKEKERGELRVKILSAAKYLFLERGYAQTSIRNIAEQIEYSPTTIYLYFKDRDAIFHALHQEGFAMMNSRMQVLLSVENPYERLMAMGKVYISFAMENSEFYDLMFIQRAPMTAIEADTAGQWNEGVSSFGMLSMTVSQCVREGYFSFTNTEAASFMIWSLLHGMISLHIRQRCEKVISPENRSQIVEMGYAQLLRVLEHLKQR